MNYVKYLRREDNAPYGVVVVNEKGQFGFAICNPKDRFSKKLALKIAFGRAEKDKASFRVPKGMGEALGAERDKALAWFKEVNHAAK